LLFDLFDGLAYDPEPLGAAARPQNKKGATSPDRKLLLFY
jgi:hypothetical protein